MEQPIIPKSFAAFMEVIYEERGRQFIERLPASVKAAGERWGFELDGPPFELSYNYVTPVRTIDGQPAVLKAGVPNRELLTEIDTLRIFDGVGAVQLLESDKPAGMMLLERVIPGTMASAIQDDEQATRIIANTIHALRHPEPEKHEFPTLAYWFQAIPRILTNHADKISVAQRLILERGYKIATTLLASTDERYLLHGDLHHENLVAGADDTWVIIDPKGVIGDPTFETARMLHNPVPVFWKQVDPAGCFIKRVAILEEITGFDRQRIIGWAICDCILSASWSIEDGDDFFDDGLYCAELMLPYWQG